MKKKGFTLVELLVVIAIIAMLMGILMPALARVRFIAQRVVCGTHLSGIGKSMLTYANDFKQKYVRGGGKDSWWGPLQGAAGWDASRLTVPPEQLGAFGAWQEAPATIGSCLFLLIKYADSGTKIFICGGDTASEEFDLQDPDYDGHTVYKNDITEAWDFGGNGGGWNPPAEHYSYAYQVPFGTIETTYYPLTPYSESDMALMADRSPYLVLEPEPPQPPVFYVYPGTKEQEKLGNSLNHRSEGQNVLFNDGSVRYAEKPYCGADRDNIYTMFPERVDVPKECGDDPPYCFEKGPPTLTNPPEIAPRSKVDSILINEGGKQRRAVWQPPQTGG